MMKKQVFYIFTHDSIAIGSDGPSHQPVEQLVGLRSIPNVNVYRPSNSIEVLVCWEHALKQTKTPGIFVLSRQSLPILERKCFEDFGVLKGGYVLYQQKRKKRDLTLLATGSEVSVALKVAQQLEKKNNYSVAVVSIPCMEVFNRQSEKYRKSILGSDKLLRVGIEAGSCYSWGRYLGVNDMFFGVDNFGLSAPMKDVLKYFQLTPGKIALEIEKKMQHRL